MAEEPVMLTDLSHEDIERIEAKYEGQRCGTGACDQVAIGGRVGCMPNGRAVVSYHCAEHLAEIDRQWAEQE